jgi:Uma2 family endonuclease
VHGDQCSAGGLGVVTTDFAFRPLPESELRVADVAYVTRERWQRTDPEENLRGAPELVVEVLSPSNTVAEINAKEKLCLENGSPQFWVVDADLRQVKVSRPDGITGTFHSNQEIPLDMLSGGMLPVAAIFS